MGGKVFLIIITKIYTQECVFYIYYEKNTAFQNAFTAITEASSQ